MGKEVIGSRAKFVINDKNDCIMYLGHLLEYAVKKKEVYWELILESITYYTHELERAGIKFSGEIRIDEIIMIEDKKILHSNIAFSKFKLFTSAMKLIENEIINIIGDYSKDKRSISYNNYLSIIKNDKIGQVKFHHNLERDELIKKYKEHRNYNAHFTSDKLCEWIDYRIKQSQEYENVKFEFGDDFNIYVSDEIQLEYLRTELVRHMKTHFEYEKAIDHIKQDFQYLNGRDIKINVKKVPLDKSAIPISENGYSSHLRSNNRETK
ncbi:hypothetical protein Amet_2380 [Alkaliphilus metalliredigens QYMF]|uniref:Uncharacterized protein n=1 Tax=Alkaliphilus metalliredigens (strain QYMF) TaxID=293826 RepID=A6TQR6_ALKMQ|nr:hypothetical protein [Alkaliphilus metalliredigens]ABR48534.1 hypothetical protein Amet_2380 [Alkaliphilus metalliredigens QYMF]